MFVNVQNWHIYFQFQLHVNFFCLAVALSFYWSFGVYRHIHTHAYIMCIDTFSQCAYVLVEIGVCMCTYIYICMCVY